MLRFLDSEKAQKQFNWFEQNFQNRRLIWLKWFIYKQLYIKVLRFILVLRNMQAKLILLQQRFKSRVSLAILPYSNLKSSKWKSLPLCSVHSFRRNKLFFHIFDSLLSLWQTEHSQRLSRKRNLLKFSWN